MMTNVLSKVTRIICEEISKEPLLKIHELIHLVNTRTRQDTARRIYDVLGILELLGFIKRTPHGILKLHRIQVDDNVIQELKSRVNSKQEALRNKVRTLLQFQKLISRNSTLKRPAQSIHIPCLAISMPESAQGSVTQNFMGTEVKISIKQSLPVFYSDTEILKHIGLTATESEINAWITHTSKLLK